MGVANRVLVFALAATSLNLISGYGGMVSFGHAAFVGMGAYTAGIAMNAGWMSAWATAAGLCRGWRAGAGHREPSACARRACTSS